MSRKETLTWLIFELQWKNNPGEKPARMGIWDKEESRTLDWTKFKSYVGQNLGALDDDFSLAYVDNEGDEIPIDSECEFQEAFRFAWKQARNSKETVIRVDKIVSNPVDLTMKNNPAQVKTPKKDYPAVQKKDAASTCKSSDLLDCNRCTSRASRDIFRERRLKEFLQRDDKRFFHDSVFGGYTSRRDMDDEPPKWFKTYMRKFKNEIVEDVKSNVSVIVRQALRKERRLCLKNNSDKTNEGDGKGVTPVSKQKQKQKKSSDEESSDANLITPQKDGKSARQLEMHCKNKDGKFEKLDSKLEKLENKTKRLLERKCQLKIKIDRKTMSDNESPVQNKKLTESPSRKQKKKKSSDEDSSDANLITAQRDVKLLKKIEKLHRSGEKKFEKLDSKLEKLENKTKRLLERKSQSKSRSDKKDKSVETVDKGIKQRKKSSDISFGTYLMDAVLLDSPLSVIHCSPGEQFVKIWNVMNTGTLPWTDKTELCLSWGTPGMKFEKKMIKCPQLNPGEKGRIRVKAVAPDYPGTFESYWHFYHMGDRFGHWIDCAVIVDGNHEIRFKHQACENTRNVDFDYLNNCNENFEIGTEEKIKLKMAELTQKLNGLQIELSQQNKRCSNEERKDQCNNEAVANLVFAEATLEAARNAACMEAARVRENQRKIAENMVEIQKRLDDISLLHSPPTANKILEMAFGDEFVCKKDSTDEGIEESDNTDDIDIDQITGKNIEPAEWKMLQLHPEFLKSCDLLREVQLRDEVPAAEEKMKESDDWKDFIKKDFISREKIDFGFDDFMDCFEDNDLNKEQNVSDSFDKNIEADLIEEDKKESVDEEAVEANEKNPEYESDSDSELSVISNFSSSSESEDDSNFIVVPMPSGTHSPECKMCQSSEAADFQDVKVINEAEDKKVPDETKDEASAQASAPPEKETSSLEKKIWEDFFAKDSKGQQVWAVTPNGECMPAVDDPQKLQSNLKPLFEYYGPYLEQLTGIKAPGLNPDLLNKKEATDQIPIYRPRRARYDDDESESKTKKLKSCRPSEYHFDASEIPEKTLKLNEEAPSTFTFTAGNEEKKDRPCCSNCGYKTEEKRDKNGNTGKKNHNNRHYNYNANYTHNFGQTSSQAKANDNKIPTVDHLPSPLLNGVLNVASTAFSTARTVLNNIKMPPMPETGCSDKTKPKSRPSIEALCKLYEMGFKNVAANQKLLEMYENDVNKVIDELLNTEQ